MHNYINREHTMREHDMNKTKDTDDITPYDDRWVGVK